MKLLYFIAAIILLQSCKQERHFDLAIENAEIFDAVSGTIIKGKVILINADTISDITDNSGKFKAKKKINANGKLVTPGFIDTHIHLTDIIGDYKDAPEHIHKDSALVYRNRLASTFLKYGVTTVKGAGEPEKWIPVSLDWQKKPGPEYPNIFICGGAIISDEERVPYINHVEVTSPEEAIKKVEEYHGLGIKYLKLYWRLRVPEMKAVVKKAKELNMNICAHIDNNVVSMDTALDLGVRNFEHCLTVTNSVCNMKTYGDSIERIIQSNYKGSNSYMTYQLEIIQFVQDNPELRTQRDRLIQAMTDQGATLSSTIHLFGSFCHRTYFNSFLTTKTGKDKQELTHDQLIRLNKAFDTFMAYIKSAHDKGLKLRIGTDCSEGGQALLSELLLFYEAGFSIKDILQIATINGAQSMNIANKYGSLAPGKKADLVIFDKSPFEDCKNFLSKKTVIKDGVVYTK